MIDRALLTGYGARDGQAVVAFEDGRELLFVPEWRKDAVRKIAQVVLTQDGEAVAGVTRGCFWSDGSVTQSELGAYCTFAIELERDVYRHYRAKRIDEADWQARFRTFWKIVIKSRQLAAALERAQLPEVEEPKRA